MDWLGWAVPEWLALVVCVGLSFVAGWACGAVAELRRFQKRF